MQLLSGSSAAFLLEKWKSKNNVLFVLVEHHEGQMGGEEEQAD